MNGKTKEALRELVLKHTVVGGYPDVNEIARQAYKMGMENAKREMQNIKLERSLWCDKARHSEEMPMSAWIENAKQEDLEKLLTQDFSTTNRDDQQYLSEIWEACCKSMNKPNTMHSSCDRESVTYYWGETERKHFLTTIKEFRPEIL